MRSAMQVMADSNTPAGPPGQPLPLDPELVSILLSGAMRCSNALDLHEMLQQLYLRYGCACSFFGIHSLDYVNVC